MPLLCRNAFLFYIADKFKEINDIMIFEFPEKEQPTELSFLYYFKET